MPDYTPAQLHRYADLLFGESSPWAQFVRDLARVLDARIIERDSLHDALEDLLDDTQHRDHHCDGRWCPVERARKALAEADR